MALVDECEDKGRLEANSVVVASETMKGDTQGRVWSFSLYRSQHKILTFFLKFYLFTYLFIFALSLHCCIQAFSSCGEGATLHCSAWGSHCGGFYYCVAQVPELGLSSCGPGT